MSVSHRAEAAAPGEARTGSTTPDRPSAPLLRIEVAPAIDDAVLLPRWIDERSLREARAKVPRREGHEEWIAVVLGGDTYDYRVSVVPMRDGEPVGPVSEPLTCICNSDELLALVDERIGAAAEVLGVATPSASGVVERVVQPEPPPASQATNHGATEPEPRETVLRDRGEDRRRVGPLGLAGIGVGVLGAGALGAGIGLVLRPDEWRRTRPPESVSTRPPGIGLAVGGGTALATGAVLLVVDLVRRRERSLGLLPTATPHEVGVSVVRRF